MIEIDILKEIANLLKCRHDRNYVEKWVNNLGLTEVYQKAVKYE